MTGGVFDRIGTLAQRLKKRVGRDFGNCVTCGKPTRSHSLGIHVECHECHTKAGTLTTDGGHDHNHGAETSECHNCGSTSGLERLGGTYICADCRGDGDADENEDVGDETESKEIDYSQIEGEALESDGKSYPEGLKDTGHWGVWALSDKDEKRPRAPHRGGKLRWANWKSEYPESHMGFEKAKQYDEMLNCYDGLAYYILDEDPYVLMDFDDAVNPETNEVLPFVLDIIERTESWAEISQSGTGVHLIVKGDVPDIGEEPVIDIPGFEAAELEIYTTTRFVAVTGDHIEGSGDDVEDETDLLEDLYDDYVEENDTKKPSDIDPGEYEPTLDKAEVEDIETTSNIEDVFDAIKHTTPSDIRLRSEKTGERGGRMDFDPSWANSKSGTRLGWDNGAFIYRKGSIKMDALQVVAIEEGIITSENQYPEGEDFWRAVEALRKRGAHIPEYEADSGNADPLGTLPLERLDALGHDEARRYAKRRGINWPDVDEVRDRLKAKTIDSVEVGETVVLSSPTGSGKTYTVARMPWRAMPDVTGDQPVIHAHRTREARDQAAAESRDADDVDPFVLKGRSELCECAAGDYDPGNPHGNIGKTIGDQPLSEWIDHRCTRQGIPFSVVHRWAENAIEGDLPCEGGEGECPAKSQFDGVPRDDSGNPAYDVVHCTHQFLHVPGLRMNTNIFIDEKPAFGIDLSPKQVRESVNAYLQWADAPVESYSGLVHASDHGTPPGSEYSASLSGLTRAEKKRAFQDQMDASLNGENTYVECPKCEGEGKDADIDGGLTDVSTDCPRCNGSGDIIENRGKPPLSWFKENSDSHALAPAFARAIWQAKESAGDRKHARIPYHPPRFESNAHDYDGWNRSYVDVVLDGQWEVVDAESVPDFSLSNSVIGLDAHPAPQDPFWQVSVHPDMQTEYTLDTEERSLYKNYERGLRTMQIGTGIQPVASGKWLDEGQGKKFEAILQQLCNHYEDFDAAITSNAAEEFVRRKMEKYGVDDPETMHFGNEESRNDFAGKDIGLVLGSIDPGDDLVLNICARLGLDAQPVYKECPTCGGSGHYHPEGSEDAEDAEMCRTCDGEGDVRERGRTFEGEDAGKAQGVLRGVREHHVAQSAGRWARDADDPEDTATVFIVTEAAPTGFIDMKADGVTWTTNDAQRERLEFVRDQPHGTTAREVADACDCAKNTARRTLKRATEEGILERTPGRGPYGADVYSPDDDFSTLGSVDCGASEANRNGPSIRGSSTYTVAIDAAPHEPFNTDGDGARPWQYQSTFEWFGMAEFIE